MLAEVYGFAAIRGIDSMVKPGAILEIALKKQTFTADVGPSRTLRLLAQQDPVQQKEAEQDLTFQQKMGYKRKWKTSELMEAQKQGAILAKQQIQSGQPLPTAPLPGQILYAMPMLDLGIPAAKSMDPAEAMRLEIEIDTPESLHYFSDLFLFGLMTTYDPKTQDSRQFPQDQKGKAQQAICQRIFNMFGYHDWVVSDALVNQQLSSLDILACRHLPELTQSSSGGVVSPDPDMKWYVEQDWARKCLPSNWPSMADRSQGGNNWDVCHSKSADYTEGSYLTLEQESFAREVLRDGTMFLFEYSFLRLQNMVMVASFLTDTRDASALMTDTAKKLSLPGTPAEAAIYVVGKLISVVAKISTGDIAGAIGDLLVLLVQVIMALIGLFMDMAKADEDNEKLQKGLRLHLDRVLGQWIQREGVGSNWLSGFRLGCIWDDHVPGISDFRWFDELKQGVSRSVTYWQRNFYLVGGGIFGMGCANIMMPQLPMFIRGIPFGVITNPSVYIGKKVLQGILPQYSNGRPIGWRRFEIDCKTQMVEFPGNKAFPSMNIRQFALGYPQGGTMKVFG
jgi:hypothetical protein